MAVHSPVERHTETTQWTRGYTRTKLTPRSWEWSIAMEVEPRIAKQYKWQHCCSCKNYRGKGMEGGEKIILCVFFWLTRRSRVCGNWLTCVILGHPIAWATSYYLLPDSFGVRTSKNIFKVGSVKFANSLSPPPIVKKVRTGSKSSQGT